MNINSNTRYAILGALALKPSSGYDLKKFLEFGIGHFWKISYGQVYPLLRQFAESNLASVKEQAHRGRPSRYLYTITRQGLENLEAWLQAPLDAETPGLDREVLLKLFFGQFVDPKVSVEHVQVLQQWAERRAGEYSTMEKQLRSAYTSDPNLRYWLLTLGSGAVAVAALSNWCDQTLVALKKTI